MVNEFEATVGVEAPAIKTSKTSQAHKLAEAVKSSDRRLWPYRNQRIRFIKQYVGPYYGENGHSRQILAMLKRLVDVLVPMLTVDCEVSITSENTDYAQFSKTFESNVNKALREMRFATTMRMAAVDTLFGVAITKTGLGPSVSGAFTEAYNYAMDPGRVYAGTVSLDNYVVDMDAPDRFSAGFEGNFYEVPVEWAKSSGMYQNVAMIEKTATRQYDIQREKAKDLSGRNPLADETFVEKIKLLDVWLPQQGMQVTLPADLDAVDGYIDEREYKGPEFGPYDTFGFSWVPDNQMPVPVIASVYDLHLYLNEIATKAARQAQKQKNVVLTSAGYESDASAIRAANDQDVVIVKDANQSKEVSFGGMDPKNMQTVAWFRDLFNLIGGNPELLSGAGPQANTATQDTENREAALGCLGDWRQQMLNAAGSVVRKIAWYEWTNPVKSRTLTVQSGGVDIPVRWTPELREGDFIDYNFDINPCTKRSTDPRAQYRDVQEWLTNVVYPMMQMGALQGQLLQPEEVVNVTGELLGIKQAARMFRKGAPLQMGGGASMGAPPSGPAPDNRVVRRLPAKPPAIESQLEQAGVETEM